MRRAGTLAGGVLIALALTTPAGAETYQPTRFDDPAPGECKPKNCSLREAISQSRRHPGKDTVLLKAGTYEIELAETPADDNAGGDLDVKGSVKIRGKGADRTTIDANSNSRVFSILGDAPKTLEKLTVTGGSALEGAGVFISPAGADTVEDGHRLKRLVIEANVAGTSGGGIHTSSQRVVVLKTTITGNSASLGGAVYQQSASTLGFPIPPLEFRDSTLSGNVAEIGGGLYADGANPGDLTSDPRAQITNSTISNNVVTVSGGGMAAILGGQIFADHVTVAYNGADSDSSGGGSGGGIYQSTGSFTFSIEDSLVKENSVGSTGDGPQCAGSFIFKGVITPQGGTSCSFEGGSTIQPEVQPRIGPLASNGGPTQTIEIMSDSLANGWTDVCPAKDQRGVARPAEDCDAGAYERP